MKQLAKLWKKRFRLNIFLFCRGVLKEGSKGFRAHHLASGVIVLRENKALLLVRDKYGLSLPNGSIEKGETFLQTAKRELLEETGQTTEIGAVAFIIEFTSKAYGTVFAGDLFGQRFWKFSL